MVLYDSIMLESLTRCTHRMADRALLIVEMRLGLHVREQDRKDSQLQRHCIHGL
jgi:hypothetical protein